MTDRRQTVPTSSRDRLVRYLSTVLGGPTGRYARLTSSPNAALVAMALVTTTAMLVGLWQKSPCYAMGWNRDAGDFIYMHTCYSDIALLYRERGFDLGNIPYLDTGNYPVLEYPVLTGAVMQATAMLARLFSNGDAVAVSKAFFDVNVVVLGIAALVVGWCLALLAGRRRWDVLIFAAAPVLVLSGTINWDLVAVALATAAMLAWARRHPVLAGVLLGLGAATKFYPMLLIGPLFVLAARAGALRSWLRLVAGAAVAWLAVNLPVMIAAPQQWSAFFGFNDARGADFGSPWLALQQMGLRMPGLNTVSLGLFALACVGIASLGWLAPRRPRLPQLAFLTVAAFLLVNKVYSPQYVLWLLPLAVLAHPKVRDLLIWQAAEVFYWLMVWMYLAGLTDGHSVGGWYGFAIGVRLAGTVWLGVLVVRECWHPERDPVRAVGLVDDPAGGELDLAADADWIHRLTDRTRLERAGG